MEALEMLWSYMQEDMKADRLNNSIRNSPLRQKAEKARARYGELQKAYRQIEEQTAIYADRRDALQDALSRAQAQLEAVTSRCNENPPADAEQTQAVIAEVEKLVSGLRSYESDLRRIQKESAEFVNRSAEILANAAKTRKEFEDLKEQYAAASDEKKQEYHKLRASADAKAVGIPEELMAVYNTVKKQISPPMARLVNMQCSGCNTSQPSAALRKIDAGGELVECETCGRILIK